MICDIDGDHVLKPVVCGLSGSDRLEKQGLVTQLQTLGLAFAIFCTALSERSCSPSHKAIAEALLPLAQAYMDRVQSNYSPQVVAGMQFCTFPPRTPIKLMPRFQKPH